MHYGSLFSLCRDGVVISDDHHAALYKEVVTCIADGVFPVTIGTILTSEAKIPVPSVDWMNFVWGIALLDFESAFRSGVSPGIVTLRNVYMWNMLGKEYDPEETDIPRIYHEPGRAFSSWTKPVISIPFNQQEQYFLADCINRYLESDMASILNTIFCSVNPLPPETYMVYENINQYVLGFHDRLFRSKEDGEYDIPRIFVRAIFGDMSHFRMVKYRPRDLMGDIARLDFDRAYVEQRSPNVQTLMLLSEFNTGKREFQTYVSTRNWQFPRLMTVGGCDQQVMNKGEKRLFLSRMINRSIEQSLAQAVGPIFQIGEVWTGEEITLDFYHSLIEYVNAYCQDLETPYVPLAILEMVPGRRHEITLRELLLDVAHTDTVRSIREGRIPCSNSVKLIVDYNGVMWSTNQTLTCEGWKLPYPTMFECKRDIILTNYETSRLCGAINLYMTLENLVRK